MKTKRYLVQTLRSTAVVEHPWWSYLCNFSNKKVAIKVGQKYAEVYTCTRVVDTHTNKTLIEVLGFGIEHPVVDCTITKYDPNNLEKFERCKK